MNKEFIRLLAWKLKLHRLARVVNRKTILVFMYHGVVPAGSNTTRDDRIDSSDLEWQIRYLVEHFDVRHVHEWMNGELPRGKMGAAITFDDGYRFVLLQALPILQQYDCPATVYLCPGMMDLGRPLWFDEVYCVLSASISNEQIRGQVDRRYEVLIEELKRLPPEQRIERMERIRGETQAGNIHWTEDCELLRWQDVDRLHDSGLVSFGAHTLHHVILTALSSDDKQTEIIRSYEAVKERTGSCKTFAYPNGLPRDFDDESKEIVRSCGMIGAVTSIPGFARRKTDPYAWPRISVPASVTRPRFELRAAGIFGEKISRRADLKADV
jgi:peptidoglycan/xylan/chitin deacetylase (PgdA/CDA1 family)